MFGEGAGFEVGRVEEEDPVDNADAMSLTVSPLRRSLAPAWGEQGVHGSCT